MNNIKAMLTREHEKCGLLIFAVNSKLACLTSVAFFYHRLQKWRTDRGTFKKHPSATASYDSRLHNPISQCTMTCPVSPQGS